MNTESIEAHLQQLVEVSKYRLAAECTAKYQKIVTNLPPDILLKRRTIKTEDWEEQSRVIATLHAYVDLCAEELALWKAGQIPEGVWKSWEEGICAGFQIPGIVQVWEITRGPYDDLRAFLEGKGLPKST